MDVANDVYGFTAMKCFLMKIPLLWDKMWLLQVESALEQGQNIYGNHNVYEFGALNNKLSVSKRVRVKPKKKYVRGICKYRLVPRFQNLE